MSGKGQGPADRLTAERLDEYLGKTERALALVRVAPPERSHLRRVAEDVLGMARAYFEDARHYAGRGDLVTAHAAVNYAHGWLDAGVRLGLLDGKGDDALFALAE